MLSGFELYPRWVPLFHKGGSNFKFVDKIQCKLLAVSYGHMYVL